MPTSLPATLAVQGVGGSGGLLLELGLLVLALSVLARAAVAAGLSPVPLYLLGGLLVGDGGLVPLGLSEGFVAIGAEVGVILLMLLLGLEFTSDELRAGMRSGWPDAITNFGLNFTPGLAVGLLMGWDPVVAALLGGVTYSTSSGTVAKLLSDAGRLGNRETPAVLSLQVMEDLTMAAYLPIVGVLLAGAGLTAGLLSVLGAVAVVVVALVLALRLGGPMSRLLSSRSDEVLVLTVLGVVLVVGGVAEQAQVSSAVGAFLVGLALSGRVADRARALLEPLRDLFAATFFLFFGLQVDPGELLPLLPLAAGLAVLTAATKLLTGVRAARRVGAGRPGRLRAGSVLIARGEFSIVVAGLALAAGVDEPIGALAAGYVLLTVVLAAVSSRAADRVRAPRPVG